MSPACGRRQIAGGTHMRKSDLLEAAAGLLTLLALWAALYVGTVTIGAALT